MTSSQEGVVLKFHNPERGREDIYDFSEFSVDVQIRASVIESFKVLTGHYAARSRRQAWRSVRKLLLFMETNSPSLVDEERKDLLSEFYSYLKKGQALDKTIGSHYNFARRTLIWLSENSDLQFWRGQRIGKFTILREAKSLRHSDIDAAQLKSIANICKREVADVRRRFSARRLVEDGEALDGLGLTQSEIVALKELIKAEKSNLWSQRDFGGRVLCHAPLRKLNAYKELTYRDALPILLLILIQTAGNPISIMEMKISCLEDHPFDNNKCILKWAKGRAGREQAKAFLRKGKYGVPELVELLLEMTRPIRHLAESADADILFITRNGRRAERISLQGIHNSLNKFREDKGLGKFSFSDIRRAVASVLFKDTNSVRDVSSLLQHKSASTTQIYLDGREAQEKKFEQLYRYQGEMLNSKALRVDVENIAETVLGFGCRNLYEGVAAGSIKDQACLQFLSCAVCPNALVLVDDHKSIARIIRAQKHLNKLKQASVFNSDAQARFEAVYHPILRIIEDEILPKVSKSIVASAELASRDLPNLPAMY
ncbi:tyrosine-type recombinase/integrase [Pseudomonas aeruginosa]|uniref:tyrosine-type recombinase/integrase n=1 Tax=Pseudomonas aeruginosa TaxID=287 RepID=UPI003D9C84FD